MGGIAWPYVELGHSLGRMEHGGYNAIYPAGMDKTLM